MSLIKTEAVVLKTSNYRDKSRIITLYTGSHGKLRAVAKGVRDVKTKWGGVLQAMAHLNALIYYKENRSLHLISGAEYAGSLQGIYDNIEKMNVGFRIVELVNKTTAENHEISGLFELILDSLQMLNNATKNFVNLLFNFEFRLSKLLGFGVNLDNIGTLKNSYDDRKLSANDLKFLQKLVKGTVEDLTGVELLKPDEIAIESFFENHFMENFDNISFSKAKKVIFSKEIRL
jgi:DNA repair protein RecO (recombination protein O)